MKKWILKAAIQKTISILPYSHGLNYLFQKYVTKGVRLSEQYFTDKLTHAIDHLKYHEKYGNVKNEFTSLELGSGWYPVVPVALFLSGAKRIVTVDISPLMKKAGILQTIQKFLDWYDRGKLSELQPYILEEKLEKLREIGSEDFKGDLLQALNLEIKITDARDTGFEANYFDLINSNNVFEHIYPDILKPILVEFQRILKPGGISSHFIDMSDHFAHLDKTITIYNFLKFSEVQWQKIDNSVQPQNRLRYNDYLALYDQLGIQIIESHNRPGSIEELEKVDIYPAYLAYSPADLAISHMHLISSKN